MRIVQLATSLQGGAGVAALRMNNALNLIGAESTIICREESINFGNIYDNSKKMNLAKKVESSAVTVLQSKLIQKNKDLVTPWSVNALNFQNTFVQTADIIHIHAYYNFLSIASLRKIVSLGKPTLFTLHDQRLVTGGCHYSRECTNFQRNCSPCPQVRGPFNFVVKNALSKQKTIFESPNNIELVTPSHWLKNLVKSGSLSKDLAVHVVRNPIPRVFFETSAQSQKKSDDAFRIAFIATNLHNPYKDLNVFTKAINKYSQLSTRQICVVLVGQGEIPKFEPKVQIENVQPSSDFEMATLLSTIDLLIVPSNQDNSPSVIGEALAAGVPVIGSDAGGIPEILKDFEMPIFPVGDASELESILMNWKTPAPRENIREKAKEYFAEEILAREILEIYRYLQRKLT
jgi:glycosyltransferase involved in cell wall biosynthesis